MIEPSSPPPEPELLPNAPWEDMGDDPGDPPDRPVLRRIFKAVYILVVVLVIVGLIMMFFPWDLVDVPFDPPFRFPERI